MAIVTGTLTDCGLDHLVGRSPKLIFTLSEPATSGSNVFVTEPIEVTPNASGAFSVDLAQNATMDQVAWYNLAVSWLDSGGNFIKVDFPDWKLFVNAGGGPISLQIPNYTPNPYMVFWQPTEPDPWPHGSVWVDTSVDTPTSGDINRKVG